MNLSVYQHFLSNWHWGLNAEKSAIKHEILECEPVSLRTQTERFTLRDFYFLCEYSSGFAY